MGQASSPPAGWKPAPLKVDWQNVEEWPDAVPTLHIDPARAGLLIIDMQYVCADPRFGLPKKERAKQPAAAERWAAAVEQAVIPNIRKLLAWFRSQRLPVIYTRVGSYVPDGRDMPPMRRESYLRHIGEEPFRCAFGDPSHAILQEVAPLPGELVIDKNVSGAFVGSAIDFHLRNLGIQTLVACGIATQACVQHTVRDAADIGYNVILVGDACCASVGDEAGHDRTLRVFRRVFGSVKSTAEVLGGFGGC